MKTYDVTITETSIHTVRVEATSEEEAERFAEELHCEGDSSFSHIQRCVCAATEVSEFDQTQADAEGWTIFDGNRLLRIDVPEVFPSDEAAIEFVRKRAAEGSEYHQSALKICNL